MRGSKDSIIKKQQKADINISYNVELRKKED